MFSPLMYIGRAALGNIYGSTQRVKWLDKDELKV